MTRIMTYRLFQPHRVLEGSPPERWIQEGWTMAGHEGEAAFESIELKHQADLHAHQTLIAGLKARGHVLFERRQALQNQLVRAGFDPAEHLRAFAEGRLDLICAGGLLVLNAALALFVLLGFGPFWLTAPLALLVLVTALPVEEFFQAYEDQHVLREGVFLALAFLALTAQFWLGTVRGMFLTALTPTEAGPVTHALRVAGPILQYSLGTLAMVSECLCGYKLYQARRLLGSATARATRERDLCNTELIGLHTGVKAAEAEPEIRRAYRRIGARQYLASHATPISEERPERHHLTRAATGAVIALLVVFGLLFLTSQAFGEPVSHTTAVLLDLTKSTSNHFQDNLSGVSHVLSQLPSGERVLVIGITDSFGNPRTLLDRTLPASAGYLGLALEAAREVLVADWQKIAKTLQPQYAQTDVLGAITYLTYFGDLSPGKARLIVFSDLRQSTGLNLEKVDIIPASKVLARLKQANSIPPLTGTKVFLLGVDPSGKSPVYISSLKEFWQLFFGEAGAEVVMFSVGRQVPEFSR